MNVLIVNGDSWYRDMWKAKGHTVVLSLQEADIVQFTGGEDVSPSFYNQQSHPYTGSNIARDEKEKRIFNDAVALGIPVCGICRGGQFLNVLNGGSMFQHVDNHCGDHVMEDVHSQAKILASSTHHQLMRPANEAVILAIAHQNGKKQYMDGDTIITQFGGDDVEACSYPLTQTLCFQPHPEFPGMEHLADYYFSLIDEYLGVGDV